MFSKLTVILNLTDYFSDRIYHVFANHIIYVVDEKESTIIHLSDETELNVRENWETINGHLQAIDKKMRGF